MKACVLDCWDSFAVERDPALLVSHWVAEQTRAAMQSVSTIQVVCGAELDRVRFEAELGADHEGIAYFGHGNEDMLYRERQKDHFKNPIPLLDANNVHLIQAAWFHAFACLSGERLCHAAAENGASAYLGYRLVVVVEWDPLTLSDECRELLATLVSTATLQLARGERSKSEIRKRVYEASEAFLAHLLDSGFEGLGLYTFANQMHTSLVLAGSAVVD